MLARAPTAVLTEIDDRFVELPTGREVDPVRWLRARGTENLAGFLGYEFAWELDSPRATRAKSTTPRCWVGVFDEFEEVDQLEFEGRSGKLLPLESERTEADYVADVQECVDAVWAGELFQVNYTTRFRSRWDGDPAGFYTELRAANRGDYFALLQADGFALASASPEMFVEVREGVVTTRPIKGTRRREENVQADQAAAAELLASPKDRAENVMIVDLMRNDLTRCCEPGSVRATELCTLESFAGLHHLVSTVRGELRHGLDPIEVLLRCFPPGSITGAPKLRAIEIAASLEGSARGAYTGTIFASTAEWLTSSVAIRTTTLVEDGDSFVIEYGAGGAVVSNSSPRGEWDEALAKLAPLAAFSQGRDR